MPITWGSTGGSGGDGVGTCPEVTATAPTDGTGGVGGDGAGGVGAGGQGGANIPEPRPLPWLHVDGNEVKDPSGNVVVLRGVAFPDLGNLESWEGGINKMIDRVTATDAPGGCSPGWATRVIRVAVSPIDSGVKTPTQYSPGGTYYEDILRPTVDYARAKGLYVIIDWHYIDDTTKHRDTTAAFWADMAPRFAEDSNVIFELYNEPVNAGSWPSVKTDMQAWYDIVRAAAPNNLVLVGTPNWCQIVGTASASPLAGTNIAYVAHMYPLHWASLTDRNQIMQASARVPVFVTEWGFQADSNNILNGTISSYGNPFKAFIEGQALSWTAWCASSSWEPTMFSPRFQLLTGEGEMGGFTKDWLYQRRDDDQPSPSP